MPQPLTNLKSLREEAGYTQAGLSYVSEVAESRIAMLENSTDRDQVEGVKLSTLLKLARTLKVKADDIYPGLLK